VLTRFKAFLLVQSGVTTNLVFAFGYGKHAWDLPPSNLRDFVIQTLVRFTFSIITIAWTKTAFAITLLRVTEGYIKKLLWIIIATVNIVLGLSALFGWTQCRPLSKQWDLDVPGKCWDHKTVVYYSMFAGGKSALHIN